MKRDNTFRGKRLDTGQWTYGFLFKSWERVYILWGVTNDVPNMIEVDPETVVEFTGLMDADKKEIFEGDIISIGDQRQTTGIIEWGDAEPAFQLNVVARDSVYDIYKWCSTVRYKVIGNIHDTPKTDK